MSRKSGSHIQWSKTNCINNDITVHFFIHYRMLLNCFTKSYSPYVEQRGDFWVLKNYVRAEHGDLKCYESVTYTTHADYTFLDNLVPLLER